MMSKYKAILIILICVCFCGLLASCKTEEETPPAQELTPGYSYAELSSDSVVQKGDVASVKISINYKPELSAEEQFLEVSAYYNNDIVDVTILPYKNGDSSVSVTFNGKRIGETLIRFVVKVGYEVVQCSMNYSYAPESIDEDYSDMVLTYGLEYEFKEEYGDLVSYDEKMFDKTESGTFIVIGIGSTLIKFKNKTLLIECTIADSEALSTLKENYSGEGNMDCDVLASITTLRAISCGVADYSVFGFLENLEKLIISDYSGSSVSVSGIKTLRSLEIVNADKLSSVTIVAHTDEFVLELKSCPSMSNLKADCSGGNFRYITDETSSVQLGTLTLSQVSNAVFDRPQILNSLKKLNLKNIGSVNEDTINSAKLKSLTLDSVEDDILIDLPEIIENVYVSNAYFRGSLSATTGTTIASVKIMNLKNMLSNELAYGLIKYGIDVVFSGVRFQSAGQKLNILRNYSEQTIRDDCINIKAYELQSLSITGGNYDFGIEYIEFALGSGENVMLSLKDIRGLKNLAVTDPYKVCDLVVESCSDLGTLDIKGLKSFSHNTLDNLTWLEIEMAQSYAYNLSDLPELEVAIINSCPVTALDFSGNNNLKYIEAIADSSLNTVNITDCNRLYALRVRTCKLAEVTGGSTVFSSLERVELNDNILTEVDFLAGAASLKILDLANNKIESLEILSGCGVLQELYVGGNSLLLSNASKVEEFMSAISGSISKMLRLNVGTNGTTIAINELTGYIGRMTSLTWLQMYKTGVSLSLVQDNLNKDKLPDLEFLDIRGSSIDANSLSGYFNENTVLVCDSDASDYKGEKYGSFARTKYSISKNDYSLSYNSFI